MRIEPEACRLASDQHGLIATWQLRALGATNTEIGRLRTSGNWDPATDRVLRRTGAASGEQGRLMTAVLDASPGAAIAGPSAAAVWGVPGFKTDPLHVVRHRGISRRRSSVAVVHEVVDLMPGHIKVVDGVPVIAPARTVCELAATLRPEKVERILEWMWKEHLLDGSTFRRTVGELAGRGRKGSPVLRQLDEARGPGYIPPDSGLERRFEQILEKAGERPMRRQVNVGDDEAWCGRADFSDTELPLVVEVQSEKHHTSLVDRHADALRRQAMEQAGLTVLEIWDFQIWHRPDEVVDLVRKHRRMLERRKLTGA